MTRYFWLLSDGKTVREISAEEWRDIVTQDWKRPNQRKLVRNDGTDIYIHKGNHGMWLKIEQLKQILEA